MKLRDELILNLPEAPDFISKPPFIEPKELITICEKMLPHWNAIRYSKPEPEFIGEAFQLVDFGKEPE